MGRETASPVFSRQILMTWGTKLVVEQSAAPVPTMLTMIGGSGAIAVSG